MPDRRFLVSGLLVAFALLNACISSPETETAPTAEDDSAAAGLPAVDPISVGPVSTAPVDSTTTEVPPAAANPDTPLSAEEVYSLVSSSVPFVQTAAGTGSGILIEDGYVVTNHHVVWPYDAVRVVFPDGAEFEDTPVVGWDPLADLAVLGPLDASARSLKLEDGEDMVPGSEVFLIGYPGETEELPQAAITRGVLSRFREWDLPGITYLQTDAAAAGGQSGGSLVNSQGKVVGISTYVFSERGFGLATSASDVAPIVEKIIQDKDINDRRNGPLTLDPSAFEFDIELSNKWDTNTFVFRPEIGTLLEVWMTGPEDGFFQISDAYGILIEADDNYSGRESAGVETRTDSIHFLQFGTESPESSRYTVGSNVRMEPFEDQDDGRIISIDDTIIGIIDYPGDWDWFSILLREGETIEVSTESNSIDTLLYVDFPHAGEDELVFDDFSGGGIFGGNSETIYHAPSTGEYHIAVGDLTGELIGGYFLSVKPAPDDADAVQG